MKLIVHPGYALKGEVTLPGDKSICHRALLLAALADGVSYLDNFLFAGVTEVMIKALEQIGVEFERHGSRLIVYSHGAESLHSPEKPIDCGNSATTLRLLAGFFSALGIAAILDGSTGLRNRPMKRIIEPLQKMGVSINGTSTGTAPLRIETRSQREKLRGALHQLPVASAQVKSTLLLAALAAEGTTTILEPGPSRDHTERLLKSLGVQITSEDDRDPSEARVVSIVPPTCLTLAPLSMQIPGDFSSAAFFMAAGSITPGSSLVIKNVGINPTRTGILDVLHEMGSDIQIGSKEFVNQEEMGNLLVNHSGLHGISISGPLVVRMIDEFPAFVPAAIYAQGKSIVSNAEELRYKESDRIQYLVREFASLGANIEEKPDGFIVNGTGRLKGGVANTWKDHRLAMSLAISGLVSDQPIEVYGAEIISESFPGFLNNLHQAGASIEERNE